MFSFCHVFCLQQSPASTPWSASRVGICLSVWVMPFWDLAVVPVNLSKFSCLSTSSFLCVFMLYNAWRSSCVPLRQLTPFLGQSLVDLADFRDPTRVRVAFRIRLLLSSSSLTSEWLWLRWTCTRVLWLVSGLSLTLEFCASSLLALESGEVSLRFALEFSWR